MEMVSEVRRIREGNNSGDKEENGERDSCEMETKKEEWK